ncbi:DnaJ domain-containing protein [bacterium AH-315-P15]|nr:DnaJ domain-containing protein [bacterium AH-315-P15]
MGWLFTAAVAILMLWAIARFFAEGDPRVMGKAIKWGGAGLFIVAAIMFALLGRYPITLMLGGAAAFLLGLPDSFLTRGEPREDEGSRQQSHHYAKSPGLGPMSENEACEVLGLPKDASSEEIRDAHKRLIKQYHPDHGGSDYLAAKINMAKDILLKKAL